MDDDKFEMNISISEKDVPKKKNQEYYEYKKISSNNYKCENKTYEFNFKKNNKDLDIEVRDIFTYQGEFYGNVKIYMSDVEKTN